jgi:predicted esterase
VDWKFLQAVYGWSALQWQAWARGEIVVQADAPVNAVLFTDHVIEYALDGVRHSGGDFYAFRKAPLVVTLTPGKHVLDLRLIRDVRAMGGIGEPTVDVDIEIVPTKARVEQSEEEILVSDAVDGVLPSPYGTIAIRNGGQDWIEVFKVAPAQPEVVFRTPISSNIIDVSQAGRPTAHLFEGSVKSLAPGQTRPIIFLLQLSDSADSRFTDIELIVCYRHKDDYSQAGSLKVSFSLQHKSRYEPHRVTHLHPGGIVSYAILRAPSKKATCRSKDRLFKAPVMLQLHGAGLEADSDLVAHALDPLPDLCAWVLFPTGVTPWSADDWHTWGFTDVQAAVDNILPWIEATNWQGIGVDTNNWFVGGHSNGGQGTWYTLLHWPDKVFAASPVSGYPSIQEYVPYKFWKPAEPKKRAIIDAATNSYRHELLLANAKGIPIQQQHGSADDNVPAYHSRLMAELLTQSGWSSNYSEVAGKGHWWDGVISTDVLAEFYRRQLGKAHEKRDIPSTFELVVANPADMGSKFGLKVLYIVEPGELGRIVATLDKATQQWSFQVRNVLAFEWKRDVLGSSAVINGIQTKIEQDTDERTANIVEFWKDESDAWTTKVEKR